MKLWIFWKHILGTTFSGMLLAFFCFHLHAVQNRILISIQALLLVFFVVFSLSWTFFSLIFLFCPTLFSRIISISMSTSFWIAAAAAAKSTQWVAAYQAPPFMGFSRQEYRSGLPLPFPGIVNTQIYIAKHGRKRDKLWLNILATEMQCISMPFTRMGTFWKEWIWEN